MKRNKQQLVEFIDGQTAKILEIAEQHGDNATAALMLFSLKDIYELNEALEELERIEANE